MWSRVEFCMRRKHGTRSLGIEDMRIHWDWKPGKCICGTEENSAELEWDSKNSSNISFCFSISIYKMSCKNGIRRIMKIELLIILQYRAAVLTSIIREIIALLSEWGLNSTSGILQTADFSRNRTNLSSFTEQGAFIPRVDSCGPSEEGRHLSLCQCNSLFCHSDQLLPWMKRSCKQCTQESFIACHSP